MQRPGSTSDEPSSGNAEPGHNDSSSRASQPQDNAPGSRPRSNSNPNIPASANVEPGRSPNPNSRAPQPQDHAPHLLRFSIHQHRRLTPHEMDDLIRINDLLNSKAKMQMIFTLGVGLFLKGLSEGSISWSGAGLALMVSSFFGINHLQPDVEEHCMSLTGTLRLPR